MTPRGIGAAVRRPRVGPGRGVRGAVLLALVGACLLAAATAVPDAWGESRSPTSGTQLVGVSVGEGQAVGVSPPGEASPTGLSETVSTAAPPSANPTPIAVTVAERPVLAIGAQSPGGGSVGEGRPARGEGSSAPPPAAGAPSTGRSADTPGSATTAGVGAATNPAPRLDPAARPATAAGATGARRHGSARPAVRGRALPGAGAHGTRATAILPSAAASGATATGSPAGEEQSSSGPLATLGRQLPLPVPDWSKPIILALLLLALALGTRARLQGRRARRLESQRSRLLGDLDAMQAALVPEVPGELGDAAVSVAYRPAEGPAAGGDFYDVFVPSPGKVAIILGDVTGHGHESLTHAALARYTVRAYLQAGLAPRAALTLAGRALEDPSCERFATVAAAVYDSEASILTYALAGHPPPILQGVEAIDPGTACSSPPLGWSIPTGRRQSVVAMPAGASACFFSDGLIEAQCELAGELRRLGRERLQHIAGRLGEHAAAQELLAAVCAEATATPDDLSACILLSRTSRPVQALQLEELEADERALAAGRVRAFLEGFPLATGEIDEAVQLAVPIVSAKGSAVFRVDLREGLAAMTVGPPSSDLLAVPAPAELAAGARARLRLVTAG